MCIYFLSTCKCIGQIYYISRNHFCYIRTLIAIYVNPSGVVITLVSRVWDVCPY